MSEILEILPGNDYLTGKVLFFDKPIEWTSFDLVHKVRHELKK